MALAATALGVPRGGGGWRGGGARGGGGGGSRGGGRGSGVQPGAAAGALRTLLKNELIAIRKDGNRNAHSLLPTAGPGAPPRQLSGGALAAQLHTELAEREEQERRSAAIPIGGNVLGGGGCIPPGRFEASADVEDADVGAAVPASAAAPATQHARAPAPLLAPLSCPYVLAPNVPPPPGAQPVPTPPGAPLVAASAPAPAVVPVEREPERALRLVGSAHVPLCLSDSDDEDDGTASRREAHEQQSEAEEDRRRNWEADTEADTEADDDEHEGVRIHPRGFRALPGRVARCLRRAA